MSLGWQLIDMLKTRIIPVLLLKDGRMVKGQKFTTFRDTGDPISAAKVYNYQDADELIFIDIEASNNAPNDRQYLYDLIEKVSEECFMPLTVGGGVNSIDDISALLNAGADKVLINSSAITNPELISEASSIFGSQCIVVGIDVKYENEQYILYSHCASRKIEETSLLEHLAKVTSLGAGEIVINSIDCDGMMKGYDINLLQLIVKNTSIPVIALGGAGNYANLFDALDLGNVHAVACASLFHFGDNNPLRAKAYLKNKGVNVKKI